MKISLDPKMLIVNPKGVFGRASDEPADVTQLAAHCQRTELLASARGFAPDVVLVDLALGRPRALKIGYALKEELNDALVLLSDHSHSDSAYYRLEGDLRGGFISTFSVAGLVSPDPVQGARRHLVSVS